MRPPRYTASAQPGEPAFARSAKTWSVRTASVALSGGVAPAAGWASADRPNGAASDSSTTSTTSSTLAVRATPDVRDRESATREAVRCEAGRAAPHGEKDISDTEAPGA